MTGTVPYKFYGIGTTRSLRRDFSPFLGRRGENACCVRTTHYYLIT